MNKGQSEIKKSALSDGKNKSHNGVMFMKKLILISSVLVFCLISILWRDRAFANNCVDPQNPYEDGSGHYAGYEWAQENNPESCDGKSQSFEEGCYEYFRQVSTYNACLQSSK